MDSITAYYEDLDHYLNLCRQRCEDPRFFVSGGFDQKHRDDLEARNRGFKDAAEARESDRKRHIEERIAREKEDKELLRKLIIGRKVIIKVLKAHGIEFTESGRQDRPYGLSIHYLTGYKMARKKRKRKTNASRSR